MRIKDYGLCIIKDKYFLDFPNIRHMDNKYESRPYFAAIKLDNEIIWLIPLSSRVDKYKKKMQADIKKYGSSIFYYISKVKGEDKVFLIGNMIPATEEYIKKPFTVNGKPFVIEDKADIKKIVSKSKRYLKLVRIGKLKPAVDILEIEAEFLK